MDKPTECKIMQQNILDSQEKQILSKMYPAKNRSGFVATTFLWTFPLLLTTPYLMHCT